MSKRVIRILSILRLEIGFWSWIDLFMLDTVDLSEAYKGKIREKDSEDNLPLLSQEASLKP